MQNRAGRFVEPYAASGQAALARNATKMPANRRLFLPDPEGVDSYPMVTFSWLLLQDRYADPQKVSALKKFITWGLTDGQSLSRDLGYIPLPAEVASISLAALDRLAWGVATGLDARRVRLNLRVIEGTLRTVQREFGEIQRALGAPRDPLSDPVIDNMLAGYALVDALLADGTDVLAMGNLKHLLELNTM